MDDIVIERTPTTIMKLDDDEQALLNEIQLEPQRIKKAKAPKPFRPAQRQPEPDIDLDAFTNPNKQTAPPRPPPQDDEREVAEALLRRQGRLPPLSLDGDADADLL